MQRGKLLLRLKHAFKHAASGLIYRLLMAGLPYGRAGCEPSELAVVCPASLGDFIVFCDAARVLRERGKQLTLICRQNTGIREFAEITGFFERIIELPHGFLSRPTNLCRLRRVRAHTVLSVPPERHILSDLYVLAVTADQRILADTIQGCSLPILKSIVDQRIDQLIPIDERSELRRYEQYLYGAFGTRPIMHPFRLPQADALARKRKWVAVFPGAGGGAFKCWPVERFAAVINSLCEDTGLSALCCGTAEEENRCAALCAQLTAPCRNLCGKTTLRQLREWLSECALVLANDSGSAHFAVACGAPTVIVCGGWEYGRFYPNDRLPADCCAVTPEAGTLTCMPCGKQRVCYGRKVATCVLMIEVNEVISAMHTTIKKRGI